MKNLFLVPVMIAIFNPICGYSGSWQSGTSLQTARDQFAGGVLNGNIIVFGGNGNPNDINLNSTELLNPGLGAWLYEADNNDNGGLGVEEVSGAVVNGNFYVFGGYGGGNPYGVFNFAEDYNPTNNTWTSLAPMPTTRSAATAVAYNNKIYVFGGNYTSAGVRTNFNVVEAYDPENNTWATETYIPTNSGLTIATRISPTIAVVGNNAYLIGGYSSSTGQVSLVSVVSVYNFPTHTWSTNGYAPFPNPRAAFPYSGAAPVNGGKIYVIGGITGTFTTNTWSSSRVDVYDTVSNTWTTLDPLPIPEGTGEFSAIVSNDLWVIGGDSPDLANTVIPSVWKYNLTNAVTTVFTYATNNGTITITEYTGSGVDVTIPSTIDGLPVTSMGDHAFANCLNLTNVTIPDSVTNIGNYEFYDCPSLTSVNFNGNAPSIGNSVFFGDNNATVYYVANTIGWSSTLGGIPARSQVAAQTFTALHNFADSDGTDPKAGLILSGNTLYGATDSGGSLGSGTVFAVNTNDSGFTNLYTFTTASETTGNTNSDGKGPDGTLVLSGNTLFGTTTQGGTNGNGTIYAVNINGSGIKTLHNFSATLGSNMTNSDGGSPFAGMILSGNILYGTTELGGTNGGGTIFAVNTNGTGFTTLHSFNQSSDGAVPIGNLILSGNILYGTTAEGGTNGGGTIFAVNTNGTGFTTLHSFTATNLTLPNGAAGVAPGYNNTDGVVPTSLILSGNTLYGTAFWGGTNGSGTVFSLSTNDTGFTTLYSFKATAGSNSTNSDGAGPIANGGLVLSGNTLYGTACNGGLNGNGTVFCLSTNGTGFSTLYSFKATTGSNSINSDGANPETSLTLSGNTLYGTTSTGGTNGNGTVFSLTLPSVIAPVFQSEKLANGQFVLTWSAVSNSVYQLQYKTNLLQTNWINIGSTITASNTVLSVTNAINTDNQRFYRVQQQ